MIQYEDKLKFLRKHREVLKKASQEDSILKPWLTAPYNTLVDQARNELGYSPKTVAQDIYNSLLRTYKSEGRYIWK